MNIHFKQTLSFFAQADYISGVTAPFAGAVRFFANIPDGISGIAKLLVAASAEERSLGTGRILEALGGMGHGLVEMVPLFGIFGSMAIDSYYHDNRIVKEACQLALQGNYQAAVEKLEIEYIDVYWSGPMQGYSSVIDKLLEQGQADAAYNICNTYMLPQNQNYRQRRWTPIWPWLDLIKHYAKPENFNEANLGKINNLLTQMKQLKSSNFPALVEAKKIVKNLPKPIEQLPPSSSNYPRASNGDYR